MKFNESMLQGPVLINGYQGTFETFFRDCLTNLVDEQDGPLSGWKSEIIACMIQNKYIEGSFDYDSGADGYTYGFPIDYDAKEATELLRQMLRQI